MTIRFDSEKMPTKLDFLEQAAGVGIEFEPESLAEIHFIELCEKVWLHGIQTGIDAMLPSRTRIVEVTRNGTELN